MVQPLWKAVWRFLKELKIKLLFDSPISSLGICPKEMKPLSQGMEIYISAELFTISKIWKHTKC